MPRLTYIDATNMLSELSVEHGLNAQQSWLMQCILHRWNRSRRNHTWTQLTNELCLRSHLSRDAFSRARNRLKQLGFIDYEKGSKHKPAIYQLGHVWSHVILTDTKSDIKPDTTSDMNSDVKSDTYTEKEEEKENTVGGNPDLSLAETEIRSLVPGWRGPLTHPEMCALVRELASFRDYPWQTVHNWFASKPEKPPTNRLDFIETGGTSTLTRAENWAAKKQPKPTTDPVWLPADWRSIAETITGNQLEPNITYASWKRANPLWQGDLENHCRNLA